MSSKQPTSSHDQWNLIIQLMILIHIENSSSALTHLKSSENCQLCSKIEPLKCLRYEMEISRKWRDICGIILLKERRTISFYLDQLSLIGCLTWCPFHSCEVQTCIVSSHEKLEIKISSWRFYLVLEKLDLRQSANTSNNSNLNFGHRCKRIFICLNQFVRTGFFFPFFVPGQTDNDTRVWTAISIS